MRRAIVLAVLGVLLALGGGAQGHITPPVVLMSDRDAIASVLSGARRFFVREVRLSPNDRATIQQRTGWSPEDDFYRFYLGRDADARLVAAAGFLTDFTIHGPVRVAVAVGPDRAVRAVQIVEVTEETYGWVKPLIDADFARHLVGPAGSQAVAAPQVSDPMSQFYGQVIAGLVRRAAVLLDVGAVTPTSRS
jgi:hypothetical protein